MTTYPSSPLSLTPALTDEATLEATLECLLEHLPLVPEDSSCSPTEAEAPYIYRSQAKAGTTSFFAYATLYVICRNKRVTLGLHAVHRQETLVATLTYLLVMLSALKIRVKRLYLDRGFYSVPVIRWLKALTFHF